MEKLKIYNVTASMKVFTNARYFLDKRNRMRKITNCGLIAIAIPRKTMELLNLPSSSRVTAKYKNGIAQTAGFPLSIAANKGNASTTKKIM
jgi:hypothetical protein